MAVAISQVKTVGQGRFRIIRRLAGGTFGDVYLGYDTERKEQVAVKMVRLLSHWIQGGRFKVGSHRRWRVSRGRPRLSWRVKCTVFCTPLLKVCGLLLPPFALRLPRLSILRCRSFSSIFLRFDATRAFLGYSAVGFAYPRYFGVESGLNVLVLDLLGPSLEVDRPFLADGLFALRVFFAWRGGLGLIMAWLSCLPP